VIVDNGHHQPVRFVVHPVRVSQSVLTQPRTEATV
jgi:hypothetical protein